MSAEIFPFPGTKIQIDLANRDAIVDRDQRPKARIEIPIDCGFACQACSQYGDLVMCWHCGYFYCHLCKPVRAHEEKS